MFDENRFDLGIDPEAGVVAGEYTGIGQIQGPSQGTGEGAFNFEDFFQNLPRPAQQPKLDYYQQLGQQLRSALEGPAQQQQAPALSSGSLTTDFDMDWLSQRLAAGSANGAKIGGMEGGFGGGGKSKKKNLDPEAGVEAGQYSGIGNIQGFSQGTGE